MKTNSKRRKRMYAAAGLIVLAALLMVSQHFRIHERVLFGFRVRENSQEWKGKSVWLNDYRVVLEAAPIDGVAENLSGLTWNKDTQTLFAVVNNPPQILELTTGGKLVRRINLLGINDPEAVEYIGDGAYIVAEERTQKIIRMEIDHETSEIDAKGLPRLTLGMGPAGNKGLEGLAWDYSNRKLYAGKERNPIHIYEVTGFPHDPSTTLDIEVTGNRDRDKQLFLTDLSSLDFNDHYQHLLVLSHESRIIIEVDKSGQPISSLSLWAGHGLSKPVPQAEGIAMDDQDILYLVSEPNLFYIFKKIPNR